MFGISTLNAVPQDGEQMTTEEDVIARASASIAEMPFEEYERLCKVIDKMMHGQQPGTADTILLGHYAYAGFLALQQGEQQPV